MLTLSRYSFLFRKGGKFFIYNTRTNSFFETDEESYGYLCHIRDNGIENADEDEHIRDLHRRKIVVTLEEDDRYLDFLKLSYFRSAYSSDVLGLTILPTIGCNLRCPYCFEESKPTGLMNDETIENLIAFIKKTAANKKYSITWFGGEPLLGISIIERILDKLNEEKDYRMTYHSIVTNGTLLNQNAIEVFKRYPLDNMQVTLDGNRDSHNSKRFFSGGAGSFDIIMDNLSRFLEESPDTHVDIRINVDNRNRDEYIETHNLLKDRFKGRKVYPYPGILRANKGCEDETFFSSKDHLEFSRMLWREKIRNLYPRHCSKGCCATSLSGYVIGPVGEIYSCWEHVGDKKRILGYIAGSEGGNSGLYATFRLHGHCFEDEKCMACGLLPICTGGCPDKRVRNFLHGEDSNLCSIYREDDGDGLESALYEYYLSTRKSEDPQA